MPNEHKIAKWRIKILGLTKIRSSTIHACFDVLMGFFFVISCWC